LAGSALRAILGSAKRGQCGAKPSTIETTSPRLSGIRRWLASIFRSQQQDNTALYLYNTPLGYKATPEFMEDQKMKDKPLAISKEKQKLLSRIKRLAGQIDAVERSVGAGDECADILMLLAAIRGGVNSLMAEILEDHIRLHITHPNRVTESPEELTEDLISLVRAYLK